MKSSVRILNERDHGLFYVYGNHKSALDILLMHRRFFNIDVERPKVVDFFKDTDYAQCSLFARKRVVVLADVVDAHLPLFQGYTHESDDVILIGAGDFRKCSKVTAFFNQSSEHHALAVFNNESGISGLIEFFLPDLSGTDIRNVARYMMSTEESFFSVILKVSLLSGDVSSLSSLDLSHYLDSLDGISLLRYIQSGALKNSKWLYESLSKHCGKEISKDVTSLIIHGIESELRAKKTYAYTDAIAYHGCLV